MLSASERIPTPVPQARIVVASPITGVRRLEAAARLSTPLIIGRGLESGMAARQLPLTLLVVTPKASVVVDAGALPDADCAETFAGLSAGRAVLTPHAGEMATLLDLEKHATRAAPLDCARQAATHYQPWSS